MGSRETHRNVHSRLIECGTESRNLQKWQVFGIDTVEGGSFNIKVRRGTGTVQVGAVRDVHEERQVIKEPN